VRTRRCAAVGVVPELVDMDPTFGIGVIAGNVVGDGRGGGLGVLLEPNGPGDFRISSKDGDWELKRVLAKKDLFNSCCTMALCSSPSGSRSSGAKTD
jgi:hypothetical protein